MRLALLIYGPLDQLSGGYLYDRQLVQAWQAQGHHVQVLSLPAARYGHRLLHNWDRGWRDRLAGLEIDVLIQDELCHPSLFMLNRQIRPLTDYQLVSLVHHLRTSELHPAPWRSIYQIIERRYLESVDSFIYHSHPTHRSVEELLGHSASGVVAPPGRDHIAVSASGQTPDHGQTRGKLRVLFVGNLIRRKGLHWLLAALSDLDSRDWSLQVVGRDDLEPAYSQAILKHISHKNLGDKVNFSGPIKIGELASCYLNADVLAVPSQHEGFGLVYLEAMGFGLPVIASASGGASDLVDPGKNGYLIEPGDVAELRRRLQDYLENRGLLAEHGRAARVRFQQQPTWSETARQIISHLKGVID